ncbi:MAG: hypothetical protein KatS3mg005_3584 [Bryobacteraceae bacterium]|nr:MAG: hypothetical protein KatS3mg005_3584 [Bryobacteraceae bacterium]
MAAGNWFEVRFKLRPAVREIQRGQQATEPTRTAAPETGRYPRAAQVLALALQFQEMIDRGEVRDYADLARLGCVSRERISQIMMLVWLAPDIQQAVLRLPPSGRAPYSETALRRIAEMPLWEDQRRASRELFGELEALE